MPIRKLNNYSPVEEDIPNKNNKQVIRKLNTGIDKKNNNVIRKISNNPTKKSIIDETPEYMQVAQDTANNNSVDQGTRDFIDKLMNFGSNVVSNPGEAISTVGNVATNVAQTAVDGANRATAFGGHVLAETNRGFGKMIQQPENIRHRVFDIPIDISTGGNPGFSTMFPGGEIPKGTTQLNLGDTFKKNDNSIFKWLADWGKYYERDADNINKKIDKHYKSPEIDKRIAEQIGSVIGTAPELFGGGVIFTTTMNKIAEMPPEHQLSMANNVFGDILKGLAEGVMYTAGFKLLQNLPMLERVGGGTTAMMASPVLQEMQKPPEQRDWVGLTAQTLTAAGWNIPGPKGALYRHQFWGDVHEYRLEHKAKGISKGEVIKEADNMLEITVKKYEDLMYTDPKAFVEKLSADISKETGVAYDKVAQDVSYIMNKNSVYEQYTEGWNSSADLMNKYVKDIYLKKPLEIKEPTTDNGKNMNQALSHTNDLLNEIVSGKGDPDKILASLDGIEASRLAGSKGMSKEEKAQLNALKHMVDYKKAPGILKVPATDESIKLYSAVLRGDGEAANNYINKLRKRAMNSYNILNLSKNGVITKEYSSKDAIILGLRAVGDQKAIDNYIKQRDLVTKDWEGANNLERNDLSKIRGLYNEVIDIATGKKSFDQVEMENGKDAYKTLKDIAHFNVDIITINKVITTKDMSTLKSLMSNISVEEFNNTLNYLHNKIAEDNNNEGAFKALEYMTNPKNVARAKKAWEKGEDEAPLQKDINELNTEEKIYELRNNPASDILLADIASRRSILTSDVDLNEADWLAHHEKLLKKSTELLPYADYMKTQAGLRKEGLNELADSYSDTQFMRDHPEFFIHTKDGQVLDHVWQDYFDVGYTLKVMKKYKTAEALRVFESEKTYWQTEGFAKYKEIAKSLGLDNREAFSEIVLAIDSKTNPNREKYAKTVKLWNDMMSDFAKELGLPKTWKEGALEAAKESLKAAKELKDDRKIERARNKLTLIRNTDYMHIPLNAWFGDQFKKRHPEKHEKISKLIDTKFKKRKTISITQLVEEGILDPGDLHIRDIYNSYISKFSDDMAMKRVLDAGKEDGLIVDKHRQGYNKASNSNKILKDMYIHPAMSFQLNTLTTPHWADNWAKKALHKTLGVIKMSAFANPLFLPSYDIYQTAVSHGVLQFTGLPSAAMDVFRNTQNHKNAMRNGGFSRISGIWSMDYYRQLETIDHAGFKKLQKGLRQYGKFGVDNVLHASSELAWTMDMVVRQMTYNNLIKKGYSKEEAGRITSYTHGAYETVPKNLRHKLNPIFFTPTFKIAMAKSQYIALKGIMQGMKGGGDDRTAKGLSKTFLGIAIQTLAFDQFMTQGLGFDRVHFGYSYSKQYEDEQKGLANYKITVPTPGLSIASEVYRGMDAFGGAGNNFHNGLKRYLKSQFYSKIHPAYTIPAALMNNEDPEADNAFGFAKTNQIMPIAPDSYTGESALEALKFVVKRTFKITDMIKQNTNPDKRRQDLDDFAENELGTILNYIYKIGMVGIQQRYSKIEVAKGKIKKLKQLPNDLKQDILRFGTERVQDSTKLKHIMDQHIQTVEDVMDEIKGKQIDKVYKRKRLKNVTPEIDNK